MSHDQCFLDQDPSSRKRPPWNNAGFWPKRVDGRFLCPRTHTTWRLAHACSTFPDAPVATKRWRTETGMGQVPSSAEMDRDIRGVGTEMFVLGVPSAETKGSASRWALEKLISADSGTIYRAQHVSTRRGWLEKTMTTWSSKHGIPEPWRANVAMPSGAIAWPMIGEDWSFQRSVGTLDCKQHSTAQHRRERCSVEVIGECRAWFMS